MSAQPAIELGNLKLALIEYARVRPLIWDRSVSCTRKEREDIWLLFAKGFNLQVTEVRKRWEGMRRMYFHELRSFLKSGKKSEWIYFSKLDSFLRQPVEALMEKFSVSKGSLSLDCIEISSNDEEEKPPGTPTAAPSNIAESEQCKNKMESTSHASNASGEKIPPRKSSVEKKDEAQPSEPSIANSSASNLDGEKICAFSFAGDEISIKPEVVEGNENQDSKLPGPSVLLSRLEKQGEILVSKKVTTDEGKSTVENDALLQKIMNTVHPDTNASSEPVKLLTTEDIRNELRKIPPLKLSLQNSRPLKPKYPPVEEIGGVCTKIKRRPVSSSKINSNELSSRSNDFRSAGNDKGQSGPASTNKARSAGGEKAHSGPTSTTKASVSSLSKPLITNKPKPCPLSKKVTTLPKHPVTTKSNAPVTAAYNRPPKKSRPSQDTAKDKESVSPSLPPYTIAEDISEYATLNPMDEEEVGEPPKKKERHSKEGSTKFKDKIVEWRQEASKLSRNKSMDSVNETSLETVRESRKNFLLSFLPDMDEMSSEQRKFFKSKLMNLICLQ